MYQWMQLLGRRWYLLLFCMPLFSCALSHQLCVQIGLCKTGEESALSCMEEKTGHNFTPFLEAEHKLGYIMQDRFFVKQAWGGNVAETSLGQDITCTFTYKDFDKVRAFIGTDFNVSPSLEGVDMVRLRLENIKRYELKDPQPLIQYLGEENRKILEQPFVFSMIKASKFSIEAYQKTSVDTEAAYVPHPMVKLHAKTGFTHEGSQENVGYEAFVGYQILSGKDWLADFESKPKVTVRITSPVPNAIIDKPRIRVKGTIPDYLMLPDEYKNQLRLYLMVRSQQLGNDYVLLPKLQIDPNSGNFEGIVTLGTLDEGDGHRYSIVAFATYFEVNRTVNAKIPHLPFNKGQALVNVTRRDELDIEEEQPSITPYNPEEDIY